MTDKQNAPAAGGKSLFSVGGLFLMLAILILINVLFSRINMRWDVTEDNLYSLSEGTKDILANLEQDVVIKVFYSQDVENIPVHIKNYAKRMLDFLGEYENYGKGKITLETYNPKPDSEEEEWAVKYGIEGANLPTGDRLFFGLVAMAADQEEAIPMFDPTREEQLEYDITRIISRVQSPKKYKVGVISSLPVFGQPPTGFMQQQARSMQPWLFITELKKSYDVVQINESEDAVPDDTDILMIIHPKGMSDALQYAVDQYVLRGGKVIAFVDPFSMSETNPQSRDRSSNLKKLMDAWGVELDKTKVVADFDYPTRLRTQDNQVEENPLWLSVAQGAFNTDAIVTGQLESMLMPVAGALKKKSDSTYDYESLVQSSANSSLTDAFQAQFGNAQMIRRNFKASADRYDLIAKVRGKFKTAFPGGKPKPAEADKDADADKEKADETSAPHLAEAEGTATILLVGDADLLSDDYYVSKQSILGFNISRMFNDNLNFLLNASEMLTGSEALISIRSRGKFERPFTKVEELEKKAQARWLAQEQKLLEQVEETNRKLRELERQKDASQKMIISPEQEAEIEKFRDEKLRVNKELKVVRRNLRSEIESLGNVLKFVNIFLMVIVVAVGGIGYAFYLRRKSERP